MREKSSYRHFSPVGHLPYFSNSGQVGNRSAGRDARNPAQDHSMRRAGRSRTSDVMREFASVSVRAGALLDKGIAQLDTLVTLFLRDCQSMHTAGELPCAASSICGPGTSHQRRQSRRCVPAERQASYLWVRLPPPAGRQPRQLRPWEPQQRSRGALRGPPRACAWRQRTPSSRAPIASPAAGQREPGLRVALPC